MAFLLGFFIFKFIYRIFSALSGKPPNNEGAKTLLKLAESGMITSLYTPYNSGVKATLNYFPGIDFKKTPGDYISSRKNSSALRERVKVEIRKHGFNPNNDNSSSALAIASPAAAAVSNSAVNALGRGVSAISVYSPNARNNAVNALSRGVSAISISPLPTAELSEKASVRAANARGNTVVKIAPAKGGKRRSTRRRLRARSKTSKKRRSQ